MSTGPIPGISVEAFESGRIDPDRFDHEAHVYLAWRYLERLSTLDALRRYSLGLQHLTEQLGVPGKYHETITCFYLFKIAERRDEFPGDWFEFKRRNPDLFALGKSSLLYRFYSRETLESERASNAFVLPDRLVERPAA